MDTAKIINSSALARMVIWLGKNLPPALGYGVADFLSDLISHRHGWKQPRALYANLQVVTGGSATPAELTQMVYQSYRISGRGYYDFYHIMSDPQEILRRVTFSPRFEELLQKSLTRQEGIILALSHTGNQDLGGRAVVERGMPLFAITAPEEFGSYSLANNLRREFKIESYPASMQTVKKAIEHLRNGGVVVTGVDRPFPDSQYRPRFFGRPAALPVGPVRMALRLKLPVYAIGCFHKPDHTYEMWTSEAIEMQHTGDADQDVLVNAERVLAEFEIRIRQDPTQWAMFYPVWPEILEEGPE